MKRNNRKGFTLIELVVVIAIIGVLAAILVPILMNHVKKSRLATANANAKTAYNAVNTYLADTNATENSVAYASTEFNCQTKPSDPKTMEYVVYSALAENGQEAGFAIVKQGPLANGKNAFFVQWHKTTSDKIIGQYPDAVADVATSEDGNFGTYISPEE